ncbi:MAG: type II toxin-antitoxin system RelE/ParE family toxin [Pseudooceanicola sp.]|nr:type II toxin-antitoxin system RelE/ParE family toxin [Pseudooceanicola sp.]
MAWKTEDSPQARADLRAIFLHLFDVHRIDFGREPGIARDLAAARVKAIQRARYRIATAPYRGTRHIIADLDIRHVTIDRAIYWFTLNEAAQTVRIEAIFHGGQDHLARMLARLTAEGGETG